MATTAQSLDKVGVAGIGTTSQDVAADTVGQKWELAVAVDVLNSKFEIGTKVKYTLAVDTHGQSAFAANAVEFGIAAATQDHNSLPSNYLQFGDKAVIGPSSYENVEGYTESFRVAVAAQVVSNAVNANLWTNGVIYPLDRRTDYGYSVGDDITVLGTGMAKGWAVENAKMATLGIFKGTSHFGAMSRYALGIDDAPWNHFEIWENSLATDFVGIKMILPQSNNYAVGTQTGPLNGELNSYGPVIEHCEYVIAPYREPLFDGSPENWDADWEGETIQASFRYIYWETDSTDNAYLAYRTDENALTIDSNQFSAGVLVGASHGGGQFDKKTAQRLFTMVNGISEEVDTNANYQSVGIFYQYLVKDIGNITNPSYIRIVPNTTYRMGITWKGSLEPSQANLIAGSEAFARFQWGPLLNADVNQYSSHMMSTDNLVNSSNRYQNSWVTDIVSGYVGEIGYDFYDDYMPANLAVILRAKSNITAADTRLIRGAELDVFVDSIWLEHQGDLSSTQASNGYCEINHYPEQDTLQVSKYQPVEPVTSVMGDGTTVRIDTTGFAHRELYTIECDFVNMKQAEYDKIQALMKWQKLGYRLALHPYLPNVPHCLVGHLTIDKVDKSFWDLTRFTFRFRFQEEI